MEESSTIPMTRARLYVLIDAFERDIRSILARYVLAEATEEVALGNLYSKASQRRADDDAASDDTPLTEYLDLREAYDLLNRHRGLLPSDLAQEIRELTTNLDRITGIRNRVMHPRPLLAGDSDAAQSLLSQFQSQWWSELTRTLARLDADPAWEPLINLQETGTFTLHNLPLPEYDETGLVGRAKEVNDLVSLLKRRRETVVTITGEGGIGKTALALEVAFTLVDDPDRPFDAVLWTSLKNERLTATGVREIAGAARDLTGAVTPLGQALDSSFAGSTAELSDALHELNTLIIIDNFETLGSVDFASLYEALPDSVTYLVTSRIGVGEYERRYALAELSERDSLRLLSDFIRARRLESLRRLTTETRVQVVARLRHNPLAIRWFVLAVEAGREPLALIRDQRELLEYCVRSVYDSLGRSAQGVLTALAILGRPVTSDELVLLLEESADDVNVGLQELMRGSLIRREATGIPGDLTLLVKLTETANEFLSRQVTLDRDLVRLIGRRDEEYRQNEERRVAEATARSLAPIVVRARGRQDIPTTHILRRALLMSQRGDFEGSFAEIDRARRINPDLWEVDRVEAFVRASNGEFERATSAYRNAYEKADREGKAVVAHFLAGHLARNVKDTSAAVNYAQEAHQVIGSSETAIALGNYLVWLRRFEEGIELIEPTVKSTKDKARLIALSSLSQAYRRWAEHGGQEERNPILQYKRARKGLEIGLAAIEAGVVDNKLLEATTQCCATALNGAVGALSASLRISGIREFLDRMADVLVRLTSTRHWPMLVVAVERFHKASGGSAAATRLRERARELDGGSPGSYGSFGDTMVGEVVVVKSGYGFIRHPRFPNNIFFHQDDLVSDSIEEIKRGTLVSFSVTQNDKGSRAVGVARV